MSSIIPQRVQFKTYGRTHSPNGLRCVYVGRPTPWANPYKAGQANTLTRAEAVDAFRAYVRARPSLMRDIRSQLAGKNLACWCALDGQPCHADVLLEIANGG